MAKTSTKVFVMEVMGRHAGWIAAAGGLAGHDAILPTIVRKKSRPYKWVVGHVPLSEVANVEKKVPRDYITEDGFGITKKCRA